jgi:hypothetical protein
MRKYEPLWLQVKAKSTASVSAPISLHARIIQAVRKEKVKDIGWQYLVRENKKRYELKETITGRIITFNLVEMPYIPKLEDL